MQEGLLRLLSARRGHFRLEPGHHGDLRLDLDALFLRPKMLRDFVAELAVRLAEHRPEMICGPLAGGAFVARAIATDLDASFVYAERSAKVSDGLYRAEYHVPPSQRSNVAGRRVAVVDDAINAGSAVRATLADLEACGARSVAIGALLVLGAAGAALAAARSLPLVAVATAPNTIWTPAECPMCRAGEPFADP